MRCSGLRVCLGWGAGLTPPEQRGPGELGGRIRRQRSRLELGATEGADPLDLAPGPFLSRGFRSSQGVVSALPSAAVLAEAGSRGDLLTTAAARLCHLPRVRPPPQCGETT